MKRIFDPAPKLNLLDGLILVLRLVTGAFMLTHGLPKFEKLINAHIEFPDPFGLGPSISLVLTILAEVVCAVFIILGAGTRLAVIPLMFAMFTAAFIIHADDPFGRKELALVYLLLLGVIFLLGSGKFSIDFLLYQNAQKKKKKRKKKQTRPSDNHPAGI